MAIESALSITYLDTAQTRCRAVATITDTVDAAKSATVTIDDALIDTEARQSALWETIWDHYKRWLAGDLHVAKKAVKPVIPADTSTLEDDGAAAIEAKGLEDKE